MALSLHDGTNRPELRVGPPSNALFRNGRRTVFARPTTRPTYEPSPVHNNNNTNAIVQQKSGGALLFSIRRYGHWYERTDWMFGDDAEKEGTRNEYHQRCGGVPSSQFRCGSRGVG